MEAGDDPVVLKLAHYLTTVFRERTGVDPSHDPVAWEKVLRAARQARRQLARSAAYNVSLPFLVRGSEGPLHLDVVITQHQFLELMMGEGPRED
ncbi:MAG: Hsp70 family protein [Bacillota bacterium]|nr:Hsp70 family protein [Bacillota bacterium]